MDENHPGRRDRRPVEPENPYLPPVYFLVALGVCVLAVLATFL